MATDKYTPWMTILSAILGLWIIATPFVWSTPESMLWSNVAAGVIIALVAAYGAYRLFEDTMIHLAVPVITAILGLWIVVSPFAFDGVAEAVLTSNVVVGIVVFLLSAYVGYLGRDRGFATTGGQAV